MAMNHPGVGDPLGVSNPYADGRPNWNLQSKSHAQGPPDHLRSGAVGVVGSQALRSPFAQDFPDKYVVPCPREPERQGMKHFDSHLARTTRERVEGGLGIPNTIRSGYDRPERGTGRRPLEPVQHWDPKDGGIWAPVKREYPKVPRREVHEGVHICERPVNKDRPVDIWPATITVQDPFKPGGLKMFPGKRNTDKDAFPNAIGYTPPDPKIDYSTVENGGPFGVKKLHKNEPVPLPEGYQARYLADSTTKSKSLAELGESNKALAHATSGPQTRHGDIFPFRPSSAARRRAAEQAWGAKPPSQPSSRQASRPPSERGGGRPSARRAPRRSLRRQSKSRALGSLRRSHSRSRYTCRRPHLTDDAQAVRRHRLRPCLRCKRWKRSTLEASFPTSFRSHTPPSGHLSAASAHSSLYRLHLRAHAKQDDAAIYRSSCGIFSTLHKGLSSTLAWVLSHCCVLMLIKGVIALHKRGINVGAGARGECTKMLAIETRASQ